MTTAPMEILPAFTIGKHKDREERKDKRRMIQAILADDEGIIVKGLKKLIDWERLGVEIVGEAGDGAEALELIQKKAPQLVVSDIAMPGLSGLEMLRQIGSQRMNTKVIFISGYQEFSYAQDAVRYGAVDYLLKPVEQEEWSGRS